MSRKTSDIVSVLSKEFLDTQATIECGFTLKCARDMIRIYNQMCRTDKYSQHCSVISPIWPNNWIRLQIKWLWVRVLMQSLMHTHK